MHTTYSHFNHLSSPYFSNQPLSLQIILSGCWDQQWMHNWRQWLLCTQNLSIVSNSELQDPLVHLWLIVAGAVFSRLKADNCSCSECMIAKAVLCLEDAISQSLSLPEFKRKWYNCFVLKCMSHLNVWY